jgi:hypothetical protein
MENEKLGTIEKGIPIPSRAKYDFGAMEIGDCMLVPDNGVVRGHAYKRRNPEFHFTVRKDGKRFRLWRIAPPPEPKP